MLFMKLRIASIFMLIVIGAVAVLSLHQYAQWKKRQRYEFHRTIDSDVLHRDTVIPLDRTGYYIAGVTKQHRWVAHPSFPQRIFSIRGNMLDTLYIQGLPNDVSTAEIYIDSPYVYIADVIHYDVYRTAISPLQVNKKVISQSFFAETVPVGSNALVQRTIDSQDYAYILEKKSSIDILNRSSHSLLEKQVDGLFCTDGKLLVDAALHRLLYVYFYRNEFIVIDTSLNLDYRSHTIDPIVRAHIEVTEIKSEGVLKLAKPPLVVNQQSAVDGRFLFINSALASWDENPAVFDTVSVVDLYDLGAHGTYRFSFYIPDYRGEPVHRFAVGGRKLIAVQGSYLVIYSLDTDYQFPISDP